MIPNPAPQRRLAWVGDVLSEHDANFGGSIGGPSAIGLFPRNISPYGVIDLIGNVWEWTRTIYGFEYPYCTDEREAFEKITNATPMQLRGGAWWSSDCSCSARYANFLYRADYGGGFRLVIVPT